MLTLNYKKKELTIACINSLWEQYAQEFKKNEMEVIIVDNDSQDDSVVSIREEIIKKNFTNMQVIANSGNAGFGIGCNVGAAAAKGEFILFLNNDTVVKDRGLVKMATYCNEHPDVAILGGHCGILTDHFKHPRGNFIHYGTRYYYCWVDSVMDSWIEVRKRLRRLIGSKEDF